METVSGSAAGRHTIVLVRPATAVIILILLVLIAVAGIIQLWAIFFPAS